MTVLSFLILIPPLPAEENTDTTQPLSLISYYHHVLKYYPLLKKQESLSNENMELKKLASSYALPKVMVNASYIHSNDPVTVFGTLLRQNKFTQNNFELKSLNEPDPVNNLNMTFYAELSLFNAYQTKYSINSAEHWTESSINSEKRIKQQILAISTDAFLQTLLSRKVSRTAEKTLEAALADMRQADELKQKGIILGADFYAAKVMLSNIEQMLNQSQSQVKTSNAVFNILMGKNPKTPGTSKGVLDKPSTALPDFEVILDRCMEMRPDLIALRFAIKAKESEMEKEKSGRLPRVSAFASAEADTENFNGSGHNYTAGIKGSLDLFDPSYVSRNRKLEINLEELKNDEMILKDAILKKIYEVYEEHKTLSKNLKISHQSLLDSKESLNLLEPLYSEGKKSIADLLEMRFVNLNSETAYFKNLFSAESLAINLLFLAGLLDENHIHQLSANLTEDR